MRHLIIGLLIFTTMFCFAASHKLIDGAKAYDAYLENLNKLDTKLLIAKDKQERRLKRLDEIHHDRFATDYAKSLYQKDFDEIKRELQNLEAKYSTTKAMIKKYAPIKMEYDRQIARELKRDEFKALILKATIMYILPLAFFSTLICLYVRQRKKYKRLLQEGKISQKEYDEITKCRGSSGRSNDLGTNPATGLPMTGIGISDVGGNVKGSSSTSSTTHQDYSRLR